MDQIEIAGKMHGCIVVALPPNCLDVTAHVGRLLTSRGIKYLSILDPLTHPDAYSQAYSMLNGFAVDNGFSFLIYSPANAVIRTQRGDGSEPVFRAVRLLELDAGEIHAKSDIAQRTAEAKKEEN